MRLLKDSFSVTSTHLPNISESLQSIYLDGVDQVGLTSNAKALKKHRHGLLTQEWRKAKNLSNLILLGHSFGGYVAAKYALKHPEHIRHLILVSPAGFLSESHPSGIFGRFGGTWKGAIMSHFWETNFTPQKLIRGLGPCGPSLIRKYTAKRFGAQATGVVLSEEESTLLTDYFHHTVAAKATGELCLKYLFTFGAFTRDSLLQRASEWKVPTTFIYGTDDWMNYKDAKEACEDMKVPCEIIQVPKVYTRCTSASSTPDPS